MIISILNSGNYSTEIILFVVAVMSENLFGMVGTRTKRTNGLSEIKDALDTPLGKTHTHTCASSSRIRMLKASSPF